MVLGRRRSGLVIVVPGVALGTAGALFAVRPFDTLIRVPEATELPSGDIVAQCRPPVIASVEHRPQGRARPLGGYTRHGRKRL